MTKSRDDSKESLRKSPDMSFVLSMPSSNLIILHEMQQKSIHPDKTTYAALIDGNIHHMTGTVDLFKPLIGSDIVLDAQKYSLLIAGLLEVGDVDFAMKVYEYMLRVECVPVTSTYSILIKGLCENKNLEQALDVFECMKEAGYGPEAGTYKSLVHHLCSGKQINKAYLLYKEMKKQGHRPDILTYNVLLDSLSSDNMLSELFKILDDMRVIGCSPNDTTLELLFHGLNIRDTKRVNKYIKELFGIVYTPIASESKKQHKDSSQKPVSSPKDLKGRKQQWKC